MIRQRVFFDSMLGSGYTEKARQVEKQSQEHAHHFLRHQGD
jgi:hypothetical protein